MPVKPLTEEEKEFLKRVGRRLMHFRKKAGYSSSDSFAYDKQLNRSQYGHYENGQNITLPILHRLLKALGVSFEEFFKELDN